MGEGTRGTPTRIAQTPECDEVSKRNRTTGRSQAPRSQNQPDDQTGEVETHDNPGREHPGEDREEVNSTRSRERELKDPNHMGTSIVSSRNGATGSDRKPPSGPEEQEKPTQE